ncbi:MAG: hypothetical protein JO106_01420, partial [Mycobacterium sp.]|nr:hypothetical protein [Mycobacterium sp.]
PNRRRRRLSTAMSAVAALAVASPFAYVAVCDVVADTDSAPQHREFVRAAVITDLPGELMSALSQGLSQFGINLPPIPGLSGGGSSAMTSPGLTSPGLMSPGLTSPGLTSPGLTSPGLTSPGLTSPGTTAAPGLLTPGAVPPATGSGLTDPGLTDPALTSPVGTGLTDPSGIPVGLDPGADGTYPILGDPSLGAAPSSSGGIVNDLMSAAQQLGVGQAIDLLKGAITQASQNAAPAAAAVPPVPPVPAPTI